MEKLADISFFESLGRSNSSMSVFNRTLAEDYVDKRGYYGMGDLKVARAYEKFLKKARPTKSLLARWYGALSPKAVARYLKQIEAADPDRPDEASVLDQIDAVEFDRERGFLPDDVADNLKALLWKGRWGALRYAPVTDRFSFINDMASDWWRLQSLLSGIDEDKLDEFDAERMGLSGDVYDGLVDILLELKETQPDVYEQLHGIRVNPYRLGYLATIAGANRPAYKRFGWWNRVHRDKAKKLLFSGEDGSSDGSQLYALVSRFGSVDPLLSDQVDSDEIDADFDVNEVEPIGFDEGVPVRYLPAPEYGGVD